MNLRIYIVALLFLSATLHSQTILYEDIPGESYTNTDMPIQDITSTVDISNCTSIEFSVDYEFPAGWEGSGNMEYLDECCAACAGDPENSLDPPCLQNFSCTGAVGCWDFMWIQFFIDGDAVIDNLIGDSGTTDAESFGTFSHIQCLDGETEAHIEFINHNSASGETNIYSNVSIICWEAQPIIEEIDPVCGADIDLIGDADDPSAVVSWEWTTNGSANINDPSAQVTTASGGSDGDEFTLTTTDVNDCEGTETVVATVGGFNVTVDGGGVVCEGMCTNEDTDMLIEITGGNPLYEISLNINGIPVPFVPSVDIDEVIRICADPDIIFPDYDDGTDPPELYIPTSFFPIDLEIVNIVDSDGCVGNIINGDISYTVQSPPDIEDAVSPEYCVPGNGTIDLTVMDDDLDPGGYEVLWFEDEELENEINNPTSYDVSNGSPVWAVVYDGDCFSEAVEIDLNIDIMPEIEVLQDPIVGCGGSSFFLPDLDEVVSVENENNPAYYLDPNGMNGPVFEIDPNDVTEIYVYDSSSDNCFDEVLIQLQLGIMPDIESPLDQLAGCGMIELPEADGSDIDFYEYNTEEEGTGSSYLPGDFLETSDNISTIYLIASSEDGCQTIIELDIVLESLIEYTVDIDSENCDSLVLPIIVPSTGSEAYFTESMGMGLQLNAGDVLYAPTMDTLYIFDPALDPSCASEDTLILNFGTGSDPVFPMDTTVCEFIVLPEFGGIHGPNIRFAQFPVTDPNSSFYPGDTLDYSQTLYVLDTIGSCIYFDSMEVTIVVEPFSGIDSSFIICEAFDSNPFDLMEILSGPDTGGQWILPNIADLDPGDSTAVYLDVLPEGNYTFQYIIEDSICGLYSSEINVEVILGPYAGMNNDLNLCSATDDINFMELISDPDTGGYWEQVMGPEPVDFSDSTSVDMTGYINGTYGFLYIIEGDSFSEFCDGESSSLFIELGSNVNAGSDTLLTVCQGETVELLDLISSDADMNGFFEGDNIIFNETSWNTSASNVGQNYLIQYIVISNDANCPNDTAEINIELLAQLSAGEMINSPLACEGDIIDLNDYITNNSPGGYFSLQSSPSVEIANGLWDFTTDEMFYYIIEASGSCPADSLEFSVSLEESPQFNASVLGSVLCDDNPEISIELMIDHLVSDNYIYEFIITDLSDNSIEVQQDTLSSSDMVIQISTDPSRTGFYGDTLFLSNGIGQYNLEINAYTFELSCEDELDINILLEIYDAYSETIMLDLCEGESYNFNGQIYFDSQTFTIAGGTASCDSIFNYEVSNYPQENGSYTGSYCEGDTINILGTDYFSNLQSSVTFPGLAAFGCDSTIDISIEFTSSVINELSQTLCEDEELVINNNTYNINRPSGQEILLTNSGCDSIINVDLDFIPASTIDINDLICSGESIMVAGKIYDENNLSGTEILEDASSNGCDSIINIGLILLQASESSVVENICSGQSITVGSDVYDENNLSGTTLLNGAASNGCDSIVNVELMLSTSVNSELTGSICPGQSIVIGSDVYDENNLSGTTVLIAQSVTGCDSIINVDLELLIPLADLSISAVCPDDDMAQINLISLDNMTTPVEIFVDGISEGVFNTLPVSFSTGLGPHDIVVSDINSCFYEEFVILDQISDPDLQINADESFVNNFDLNYETSYPLASINWFADGFLSCNDCDSPVIFITEDTEVELLVTTEEGCEFSTSILLNHTAPADSFNYYIPNIISLSDFGNNNFNIFSDEDVNIEEVKIYDRWGNLIYINGKYSNPDVLWDGRRGDKLVEQGVYVYKIVLIDSNLEQVNIVGSLTILR